MRRPEFRPGTGSYWILVAGYVLLLFSVQPFLGYGIDAFKRLWGDAALDVTTSTVAAIAAALVVLPGWRLLRRARAPERLALALAAALYGLGVASLEIPQERLHYVEYGLLAALLYVGLASRASGAWLRAALVALLATVALGTLDEVLQGWLWPRRYFDWADVRLNAQAAVLGVLTAVPAYSASRRPAD